MLTLRNLRKQFGQITAVDDLSLDVPRGTIFGFLGPNGAGKTTTINMAVGLLRPTTGQVDLDGRGSPADPAIRRLIGVAPQSIALYDQLTALENLTIFGRLYALRRVALAKRCAELLEMVGLTDRAASRVGWGVLMLFSMIGGGMIPLEFLPEWIMPVSNLSPIRWSIFAIQGGIWRPLQWHDMLLPLGILIGLGTVGFAVGLKVFGNAERA